MGKNGNEQIKWCIQETITFRLRYSLGRKPRLRGWNLTEDGVAILGKVVGEPSLKR